MNHFEIISQQKVTQALNKFSSSYHNDYFSVRKFAKLYLEDSSPSNETAKNLSVALVKALKNWGSGKRAARPCKTEKIIADRLQDEKLFSNLKKLENSINHLSINSNGRVVSDVCDFRSAEEFDDCLSNTLQTISNDFFDQNKNVTYPMKAILLITGIMPAFDSRVRDGLKRAGVEGFTQSFHIPGFGCANSKKICTLPFYIAECAKSFQDIINDGVKNSKYPQIQGETGRIFDVLLFMQYDANSINFVNDSNNKWYNI